MDVRPEQPKVALRSPQGDTGPTPVEIAYWKTRVLRQRYTTCARPGSENELFAHIEHGGLRVYFPLGTDLPEKAAVRACEIYCELASDGWNAVRQRHVRQIIWAMFWFTEPLACTYATLFTVPGQRNGATKIRSVPAKKIPVAVIGAEPEVLRGLAQSIDGTKGYVCVRLAAGAKELLQLPVASGVVPRLVLFNWRSLDLATETFQEQLQARWPGVVAIPFSIFGHSDELFMSVSGMERGYFLRRRPPAQILEPLANFWPEGSRPVEALRLHVQRYFQKLVLEESLPDALSQRELEMMRYLGLGHTDKTIASQLGISVWTVHTHVKNIFEKLGVHTRAEAVMRYLQR